jgi:poly(hydroxyalkanoate) depolymerase family esterase
MKSLNPAMQEAMRLMKHGDLHAATQAIQQHLGSAGSTAGISPASPGMPWRPGTPFGSTSGAGVIDGEFRVVGDPADAPARTPREGFRSPGRGTDGTFKQHHFACDAGVMQYKLFIPTGLGPAPAPLLVMLHGCTQSPDDFARGTRMNALAQQHGYVVAYPAQTPDRNPNKCWNWFRHGDQQRGQGEPEVIAALTRHLIHTHKLDARRAYVAGLSAGGAMAAVLASTHPDVFAAVGVHSGLPKGLARDMPSAFAAMRTGAGPLSGSAPQAHAERVPTIVFHGDGDTTVHPSNGSAVIDQSLGDNGSAADAQSGANGASRERGTVAGGRSYTRTLHRQPDGSVAAEYWVVHGAPHAWSGGDPGGSYTDPTGPDASAEMLRFFTGCVRPPRNG